MPDNSTKSKQPEKKSAGATLRKKAGSLVKLLESFPSRNASPSDRQKWQRWAIIVVTALISASIMAPSYFRVHDPTVGEPAKETIISPITFRVIDESATNKNRDEVLKSVLPIYDFDDEMVHDVQSRIRTSFEFMRTYLAQEAKYRSKETQRIQGEEGKKSGDAKLKTFRPMDEKALRTRFENLLGAKISPSAFASLKSAGFNTRIQRDLTSLLAPVLLKGVVLSRELVMREGKDGILLLSRSKGTLEARKDLSTVFDLKEAVNFVNLEDQGPRMDVGLAQAIRQVAMELINVNITYNREKSAENKQKALESVKPVYFQVAKGESIIRKGEPVNEAHLRKLAGLRKANPLYSRYMILIGFALTLILLLRLASYFAQMHLNRQRQATADLLLICILMLGSIIMIRFVAALSPLATSAGGEDITAHSILFAAPLATGAMLMGLMVDARMAFIFATISALAATLAVEGNVYLFCFYFVSGVVGLHGMTRITDRTSILRAGLVVGLVNMFAVLATKMALGELTSLKQFYQIGLGFLGGVLSGLLVSSLSPLLEPLGYITNVRLLEIANLNHPLLKDLAFKAPGTYHHSIMVGNIAESAAEQIGANPLLTRVGALYHDIGKVGKKTRALYFIENQQGGENPHDKLEPSMSALILVSHVKDGVEKANQARLGAPIVDIIREHHGTNIIKVFYNKALAKAGKNRCKVREGDYRYHGPPPQTKEAALVMLADIIEASSRTLNEPTPARIQKHVQSLVMSCFSEGQLDQSTLTLKDLHAITRSFVRSLQGILHSRIDYPDDIGTKDKPNGDTLRQPTEKDRNRRGRTEEEGGASIRRLGL